MTTTTATPLAHPRDLYYDGDEPLVSGTQYTTTRARYARALGRDLYRHERIAADGTRTLLVHPALAPDRRFYVTNGDYVTVFDLDIREVDELPMVAGLAVSHEYHSCVPASGVMRQPADFDAVAEMYDETVADELADGRMVPAMQCTIIADVIRTTAALALADIPIDAGDVWAGTAYIKSVTEGAAVTRLSLTTAKEATDGNRTTITTDTGARLITVRQ